MQRETEDVLLLGMHGSTPEKLGAQTGMEKKVEGNQVLFQKPANLFTQMFHVIDVSHKKQKRDKALANNRGSFFMHELGKF